MHRFHNAKIPNLPLQLKGDLHIYTSLKKRKKKGKTSLSRSELVTSAFRGTLYSVMYTGRAI